MKKQNETAQPDYIVYTDGGCAQNPGGRGGAGSIILYTRTGKTGQICRGYYSTTNNRMEIMAVINAFEYLPDICSVELYSDSQLVLNCIAGKWKKKKNRDLWERLDKLLKGKRLTLHWVKGHDGNPFNEKCDELATLGMNLPELLNDEWYEKHGREEREAAPAGTKSRKRPGGAMSVTLIIPEPLREEPSDIIDVIEYVDVYDVTTDCAQAVIAFNAKKRKSFKDYMRLKTGGIDAHSRKSIVEIADTSPAPDLFIATLVQNLPVPKDRSALV